MTTSMPRALATCALLRSMMDPTPMCPVPSTTTYSASGNTLHALTSSVRPSRCCVGWMRGVRESFLARGLG
eukprot:1954278-Rhodomonas_salina.3